MIAASMGKHAEACEHYGRALRLRPDLRVAWVNLGHAHLQLARLEEARAAYVRALTIDPGSVLLGEATQGRGVRARWSGAGRALRRRARPGRWQRRRGLRADGRARRGTQPGARPGFYEDLWFSERTERWDRYVADEYVVHDIGSRKSVTEPGIAQKETADFRGSDPSIVSAVVSV